VQVQVGDKVKMEVYGKYITPTANNSGVVADMAGAFISAFGTPAGATLEGSFLESVNEILFPAGPFIEPGAWEDDNAPKAYLNYILFDQNYVPYKFGFDQIDIEALEDGTDIDHDLMQLEVTATKNGYAYIYLSNENDKLVDVFFDDFKIEHEYSGIIQQDDFYAFGLAHNQNPQRQLSNKYLYQGKEWQDDLDLRIFDFHWRGYDPALIRTWQQDPHGDGYYDWSPYSWVGNNPVSNIDPDGMDWYRDQDGNEILIYGVTGAVDGYEWVKADNSAYQLEEVTVRATAQWGDRVMGPRDGVEFLGGLNDIFGQRQWTGIGEQGYGTYDVDYQGRLQGITPITGNPPDVGLGKIKGVQNIARGIGRIKSLQGKSIKWLLKNKPRGWRKVPADRGSGWKWIDENGVERLRFMRPSGKNPANSKWSRQSNGYFRWRNEKGDFLDVDGNVVPLQDPDFMWKTHIPYEGL